MDRSSAASARARFFFRCVVVTVALPGTMFLSGAKLVAQVPEATCEKCHGDAEFFANVSGSETHTFLVPDSTLFGTAHGDLSCTACHEAQGSGYPHPTDAPTPDCASCHEPEGIAWSASVHSADQRSGGEAPDCVRCHSAHSVLPASDRASPIHALNVAELCGECHADPEIIDVYFAGPAGTQARTAVEQYHETVHGLALDRGGLVVSATCNDCHGAHLILPADSSASSVNHLNIPLTCGKCHEGVQELFEDGSSHGEAFHDEQNGNGDTESADYVSPPVCTDCHTAHGIVRSDDPAWFRAVVEECGSCHERVYETYFGTYHGQVTRLGGGLTAKCSDCHTAHTVLPPSNLESSVSPVNLVETCGKCHENANNNFVRYYAHGDMRDRERYPVLFWPWMLMTTLLVSVWCFFGVHSALWLNRSLIESRRSRRRRQKDVK